MVGSMPGKKAAPQNSMAALDAAGKKHGTTETTTNLHKELHKCHDKFLVFEAEWFIAALSSSKRTPDEKQVKAKAIEQQVNAKTAGNFIRNLSKDHLSSLMGGGGGEATTKSSTANKNDTKIMASGTLGSAISTGELQSLLAGYHLDDVRGS